MAIAYDSQSTGIAGDVGISVNSTDVQWTHVPAGTPGGVVVGLTLAYVSSDQSDPPISASYGGTPMSLAIKSTWATPSPFGNAYLFSLGSSVPGSSQQVVIDLGATGTQVYDGWSVAVTASTEVEAAATDRVESTGSSGPELTLNSTRDSYTVGVMFVDSTLGGSPSTADYIVIRSTDSNNSYREMVRAVSNSTGTHTLNWTAANQILTGIGLAVGELSDARSGNGDLAADAAIIIGRGDVTPFGSGDLAAAVAIISGGGTAGDRLGNGSLASQAAQMAGSAGLYDSLIGIDRLGDSVFGEDPITI